MQALMGVAVHGRARTVHFGHARDVIAAFQAQLALDGQAHFLAARLGPQIILRSRI